MYVLEQVLHVPVFVLSMNQKYVINNYYPYFFVSIPRSLYIFILIARNYFFSSLFSLCNCFFLFHSYYIVSRNVFYHHFFFYYFLFFVFLISFYFSCFPIFRSSSFRFFFTFSHAFFLLFSQSFLHFQSPIFFLHTFLLSFSTFSLFVFFIVFFYFPCFIDN